MKKIMTLIVCFMIIIMIFPNLIIPVSALTIKNPNFELNVKSAVLMDANTGTLLYTKNHKEALPPASVTKIMTLLIVFEALENGKLNFDDELTASERAASMGGSQVFLKAGEKMKVEELLKCVIVASANDAAVTLAEHVGGSIEDFVILMNEKAMELGMQNTKFENVTGLDDSVSTHLISAEDIALMSKALLKYDKVKEYATIWMDTIRNGEFGLTNTNRLVRYYKGITGLKTGYTSKSGYCISATAKRGEIELIAVVMGAESSQERNLCISKLLDFGFANYNVFSFMGENIENIKIQNGTKNNFRAKYEDFMLLENLDVKNIDKEIVINENIKAPIQEGDIVGVVKYKIGDKVVETRNIVSLEKINEINFFEYVYEVLKNFI